MLKLCSSQKIRSFTRIQLSAKDLVCRKKAILQEHWAVQFFWHFFDEEVCWGKNFFLVDRDSVLDSLCMEDVFLRRPTILWHFSIFAIDLKKLADYQNSTDAGNENCTNENCTDAGNSSQRWSSVVHKKLVHWHTNIGLMQNLGLSQKAVYCRKTARWSILRE